MLFILNSYTQRAQVPLEVVPMLFFAQFLQALTFVTQGCQGFHVSLHPFVSGPRGITLFSQLLLSGGQVLTVSLLYLLYGILRLLTGARNADTQRTDFLLEFGKSLLVAFLAHGALTGRQQPNLVNSFLHLLAG